MKVLGDRRKVALPFPWALASTTDISVRLSVGTDMELEDTGTHTVTQKARNTTL